MADTKVEAVKAGRGDANDRGTGRLPMSLSVECECGAVSDTLVLEKFKTVIHGAR